MITTGRTPPCSEPTVGSRFAKYTSPLFTNILISNKSLIYYSRDDKMPSLPLFCVVLCPIRPRLPDMRQSLGQSADEQQRTVLMGISPQLWFSQSPPQCLRRLTVLIRFNARAIGWKEVSLYPLSVIALREELLLGRIDILSLAGSSPCDNGNVSAEGL